MCGIIGYVGGEDCAPLILRGLERLEYRGYDSAGIAIWSHGAVDIRRAVGKLCNLRRLVEGAPLPGTTGIGHTRWATHGRPSEANAHPHRYGRVTVVHNGIIENHRDLRRRLQDTGHAFSSETDTEILAHLVHDAYHGDPVAAVREALAQVQGSYAVVVLHDAHPDRLVASRLHSPLVLGLGEGATLLASDIPPLLSITRDIVFLEDGDLVEITAAGHRLLRLEDGAAVARRVTRVTWTPGMAEKGGYKHFMLKEIFEQPRAVSDTVRSRILLEEADVVLDGAELDGAALSRLERVVFLACGTSYHAGLVGRHLVESFARIPTSVEIGSEFRYRDPLLDDRAWVVAISQSGETADTLAAAREAREKGARVVSICNVLDASLPRLSDGVLYTHAGPEIGVASTKAFTTQLAAVYLLAVWLGRRRGTLTAARALTLLDDLMRVPSLMERVLAGSDGVRDAAQTYRYVRDMLFLGRNLDYPIALEGALKLKEISYIHAEGYPAGEMKHGPIALIDEQVPTVALIPRGPAYEKTLSNVQEVQARGGRVIAVATEGDHRARDLADHVFWIPEAPPAVLPLLTVLPLQLFAYHVADLRGTDVDQPRNLAKSVTVE
ncbi:MAG: glutamine--fructose-6-phosphate transaminase (isomerizing) [Deltaproteobacteria bacterium]|nr:glutamine--fructose-6-phosphate transaminase (isomerizing) [Deltaproteobacteria bacterium]